MKNLGTHGKCYKVIN